GLDILVIVIVATIFYLLGTAFMGRIVKKAVQTRGRDWHKKDIEKRQKTLAALFTTMWRVAIITVATLALFRVFFPTADLAPLFASAGIVGIALGFGAQSLVQDFISGIFIISENQYRVGDIVDIEGFGGTVERIGARSTVIRDVDGNVHYFPNGMVQHVINKTMGYSMARFIIGVAPTTDIDQVIEIINETGKKLAEEEKWKKKILEAPEFVSVGEFTATNVDILVAGKTQPSDQWSVIAEMRRRLFETFEAKGIKLGTAILLPPAPKK
ncbi:MAG TPA: mechanosensitive ion channel family protein, partial [Candidatus Saccharimonadales bacterium]